MAQLESTLQGDVQALTKEVETTSQNIIVDPGMGFSPAVCRNHWAMMVFEICSHEYILPIVLVGNYFLTFLYTCYCLDMMSTLVNIFCICILCTINRGYIGWSTTRKTQELFITTSQFEKFRIIVTLLLFTLRFLYLHDGKIVLIPAMLMIIVSSNKISKENVLWGLLPSVYFFCLYVVYGVWRCGKDLMVEGVSELWVLRVCLYMVSAFSVMTFTFYLIVITGFLKKKVDSLEETKKDLVGALGARNTFMSHVSHEFR